MRLTHSDYVALWVAEDWKSLWVAAVPWVKFVASSFKTANPDDLLQELLLQIGALLPKWNPALGPFSQFVTARARYAAYAFLRQENARDAAAVDFDSLDDPDLAEAPEAAYGDTGYVPHGYGDAAQEIARIAAPEAVEALLRRLDPEVAYRLRERWGLPAFDEEGEETAVADMAIRRGVPRESMRNVLKKTQEKLAAGQKTPHVGSTRVIYSPPGRQPLPEWVSVDEKYPGFWHGLAAELGDVAVWRESVGAVHGDWSWKPTADDIKKGCKP